MLCLSVLSLEFEESLRDILKNGNFDDITRTLTPRALTKCNTNTLRMAMEVRIKEGRPL